MHLRIMRTFTQIIGWSLVAIGVTGGAETRPAWSSMDSWFHPRQNESHFQQVEKLPDADVMEVAPAKMPEAEEQLRDVVCVELSSQRASELTGQPVKAIAGGSLFLVRAVYLNRGTGKFTVSLSGRNLLVEHGSLGHSAVPMKRQALVVRLRQKPDVVYVSYSMAE